MNTLSLRSQRIAWVMTSVICFVPLIVGCDSAHRGQSGISGYWKGQMIEAATGDQAPDSGSGESGQPRRILMRLEEKAGIVRGEFAQSSDAIAFKQLDYGGSRSVITREVAGTRDGSRIHLRFSSVAGRTINVEAIVSADMISGTYSAKSEPANSDSGETVKGKFRVERY